MCPAILRTALTSLFVLILLESLFSAFTDHRWGHGSSPPFIQPWFIWATWTRQTKGQRQITLEGRDRPQLTARYHVLTLELTQAPVCAAPSGCDWCLINYRKDRVIFKKYTCPAILISQSHKGPNNPLFWEEGSPVSLPSPELTPFFLNQMRNKMLSRSM